jgi:hypothetical protein
LGAFLSSDMLLLGGIDCLKKKKILKEFKETAALNSKCFT